MHVQLRLIIILIYHMHVQLIILIYHMHTQLRLMLKSILLFTTLSPAIWPFGGQILKWIFFVSNIFLYFQFRNGSSISFWCSIFVFLFTGFTSQFNSNGNKHWMGRSKWLFPAQKQTPQMTPSWSLNNWWAIPILHFPPFFWSDLIMSPSLSPFFDDLCFISRLSRKALR